MPKDKKQRDTTPVNVRLPKDTRHFLRWLSFIKTMEAGETVDIGDLVGNAIVEKYAAELEQFRATVKPNGGGE